MQIYINSIFIFDMPHSTVESLVFGVGGFALKERIMHYSVGSKEIE
jgi:hypothetical protein